jgi:hypothetical protein
VEGESGAYVLTPEPRRLCPRSARQKVEADYSGAAAAARLAALIHGLAPGPGLQRPLRVGFHLGLPPVRPALAREDFRGLTLRLRAWRRLSGVRGGIARPLRNA